MAENNDLPSLDSLRSKIHAAKGVSQDEAAETDAKPGSSASDGWRAISDLVAGIAVGGFLGYHGDEWLQTRPALLITGVLLGMAGGIMNIYRASMRDAKRGYAPAKDEDAHPGEDRS